MDLNNIKVIIKNILPSDITDAIYIFGSYGTEYFVDGESDIDIAWYTKNDVDWLELEDYRDLLVQHLNIEVDLINNPYKSIGLTVNTLTGILISNTTEKFDDWLFKFNEFYRNEVEFLKTFKEEKLYGEF